MSKFQVRRSNNVICGDDTYTYIIHTHNSHSMKTEENLTLLQLFVSIFLFCVERVGLEVKKIQF